MSSPKELRLDQLRIDGGTQPRETISQEVVTQYAEDMLAGAKFPHGEAVFDGKDYWLWDGFHRYHACLQAEFETMEIAVRKGTVEDARWLALSANKTHGVRRTNSDKRRAVEAALQMRPDWSDRKIAEHVGVGHPLVGESRKRLEESSSQSTTRTGRDGRTIDTSNIGRKPLPLLQTPTEDDGPEEEEDYITAQSLRELAREAADNHAYEHAAEYEDRAAAIEHRLGGHEPNPKKTEIVTLEAWNALNKTEQRKLLKDAAGTAKFNDQGNTKFRLDVPDEEAEHTVNIEWALWSWNPVTGCLHNCPYCYARDIAERFYPQKFTPSIVPSRLKAPQNTPFPEAKAAGWMGHKNVFVCSMADLFGRWVPAEWIEAVLAAVAAAPPWNFLFLTKFPQRMADFKFPDNAWTGTTVDCQARVANAEKAFKKIRAGVKWLSCEPLIEPLKFDDLSMFDWIVLGGASKSTQTPEWHPPRQWVYDLERAAKKAGCRVYEKTNLWDRIRQYPGIEPEARPTTSPLVYLPTDSARAEKE